MKTLLNNLKLKFAHKNLASEKVISRYMGNKTDSWAIVTGCTSGIGKAYAEFLHNNKFGLILISRNQEKLDHLVSNLPDNQGRILKIQMDFSSDDVYTNENFNKYLEIFSQHRIRLLINNVGDSTFGGDFYHYDMKKNKSMVNVNANSCVFMSKLFLESQIKYSMENNESDRRGIINISSYFGVRPVPGVALYSSTKAFITNFTSCLFYEVKNIRNFKTDVLCVNPLFVKTGMVKKWNNSLIIKPEQLVHSSFIKINGFTVQSYGHWKHIVQSLLLNILPNWIFCRLSEKFYTKQWDQLMSKLKNRKKNK